MRDELLLEYKGSSEQKAALKSTKKFIELRLLGPLFRTDKLFRSGTIAPADTEMLPSLSEAREIPFPKNKLKGETKGRDSAVEGVSRQVELDAVSKKISSVSTRIRQHAAKLKWNKEEIGNCEQNVTDLAVLFNSLLAQMKELEKENRMSVERVHKEIGAMLKAESTLFSEMFSSY
eukprot:TRINITY_DN10380_c0_g2_i1.p1 TRINITY_DN10380_c0_g2~~TRINITY_DN10380_c0_g2_i1.p1  ORF type:complete len:176 (-),score=55.80 TRINITY_DN10380_c0_g2_i1:123-650(-)